MMYKKFILVSVLISVFSFSELYSQSNNAQMSFEKNIFDFGIIKEDGGLVTNKFIFTNTGAEPVIISNVKASCGCTTPDWSKNPIPPGGKGFVSATYNPLNRPGAFNKTITITSNAEGGDVNLIIKGEVQKKEQTIEDEYRYTIGELRLKSSNINFNDLFSDEIKTLEVEIINPTTEPIVITFDKRPVPENIKIEAVPSTLAGKQKGKFVVTYDASKKNDWDYVSDRINVSINGKYDGSYNFTVSATIKEKFSQTVINNPPAITFPDGNDFEFGTINEGDKVEHLFKFKNTGKSDLIIRKTRTSCGCTVVDPASKIIKPGEESQFKVIFNSSGKSGAQTKVVTVITNIPGQTNNQENSRVLLKMNGSVTKVEKN